MNDELFAELLESVREGGAILRGQKEPSRTFAISAPDVKRIREQYALSQSEFAAMLGVSIRAMVQTAELVAFFDAACDEMVAYLAQAGVRTVGPPMALWHGAPGQSPNASDIETCWPIEAAMAPPGRMRYRELPAELQAFTVHHCAYDDMVGAFDAVWQRIEAQGYSGVRRPKAGVLQCRCNCVWVLAVPQPVSPDGEEDHARSTRYVPLAAGRAVGGEHPPLSPAACHGRGGAQACQPAGA